MSGGAPPRDKKKTTVQSSLLLEMHGEAKIGNASLI